MTIEQRSVDSVVVLDLSGRLVLGDGSGLLKDKINSVMFEGNKRLLLNLAGVTYMDSAGLGELIAANTTVTRQGGAVKVANLTKRVSDLLVITKVINVFDVHESEAEALKAFT
jgi:anti-sigma B factor antagonist